MTKRKPKWVSADKPTPRELAKFRAKYPGLPEFLFRRALITEPQRLTDQQITAAFEAVLGLPPRATDLAVLRTVNPRGLTVANLADYIHDHWLGSPDEPTLQQVEAAVRRAVEKTDA